MLAVRGPHRMPPRCAKRRLCLLVVFKIDEILLYSGFVLTYIRLERSHHPIGNIQIRNVPEPDLHIGLDRPPRKRQTEEQYQTE